MFSLDDKWYTHEIWARPVNLGIDRDYDSWINNVCSSKLDMVAGELVRLDRNDNCLPGL